MPTFSELELIEPLLDAVEDQGYTVPTPIQAQAIPPLLEGRDVLGCAQTGTGKTAAFTLPVLQHIETRRASRRTGRRSIRALVLTPTRELAAQIGESIEAYGRHLHLPHTVIFGGVKQGPQVRKLQRGVAILVATPGRLLDLIEQGYIDLSEVEFFVLDEADRMLDMGFIHDVRRVLRLLPDRRQNLLFSATMPESIVKLAGSFLTDPIQVEVTPEAKTVDAIVQSVMFCQRPDKRRVLAWLIRTADVRSAIVFTRTKHGANRLVKQLDQAGIRAAAIHGNKSQGARTRALDAFRRGDVPILVATDLASRGIDVEGVSHVFNYDLPNIPESYVHRIGRTARAGKDGVAISFCDDTEGEYLRDIEHLIGFEVPVDEDHQWHDPRAVPAPARRRGRGGRGGQPSRNRRAAPREPRAQPSEHQQSLEPQESKGRWRGQADPTRKDPQAPRPADRGNAPANRGDAPADPPRRRRRRRKRRGRGQAPPAGD